MRTIKSNLPCPNCGSSDALTEYADGSYCFSCKRYTKILVPPNLPFTGENVVHPLVRKVNLDALPSEAIIWLKKQGLTDKEIYENRFAWEGTTQRMVYPVESQNGITGYEKRKLSKATPKTIFQGSKVNSFHLISPKKEEFQGVIAVEDIISAIKVGRVAKTLCLFGSQCSTSQYHEISRITDLFILWLDLDKFEQAVKITQRAQSFGLQTKVIKTDLDPKKYSTKEIREIINAT